MTVEDTAGLRGEFIQMALHLGASQGDAEDIVQEFYLRLCRMEKREGALDRLSTKSGFNMSYAFTAIKNMYLTKLSKERRMINELPINTKAKEPNEHSMDLNALMSKLHWYDRELFLEYALTNHSFNSLSKATRISYSSIYNTITNVKQELKKKLEL